MPELVATEEDEVRDFRVFTVLLKSLEAVLPLEEVESC